ncbi:MAG TPA: serine/threonine-protein kinase [Pyrinomonadaceae bacterium]
MLAPDALLQNRYLIIRPIGKGGMGAVYEARDQRLGNTIALKETFFEDELLRKAFEREARLLAGLRHPALPRVIDHFTEGAGQFLVMEFIPGSDLEEMFKEKGGPFPLNDVMKWADQLLDALDYLHTQETPIIHRDIKPQNLKLAARGQIILLDFGLAKGSAAGMSQASATGSIFGYTPTYAPLEQVHGAGTDPRSDLYSLAATLYHLLTGAKPPDALARASAVIGGQPDPIRPANELNPQISPAIAGVLAKAMSIHGDGRPATAEAMRRELSQAAQTVSPSTSSSTQATVIIPPQVADSAVRTFETAKGSDATTIDVPSGGTVAQTNTATVIEEDHREGQREETPAPVVASSPAPVIQTPAPPSVESRSLPAPPPPKSNRLILLAGGIALLLVAGIVIYSMTGGFSSDTSRQASNNAIVAANQNQATPSPAKAAKSAEAAPVEKRKETTQQQSSSAGAASTDNATDRRAVLPRPAAGQRPEPIRERLRPKPKQ